jgi:type IV fimbrial biogenesis protein FimT
LDGDGFGDGWVSGWIIFHDLVPDGGAKVSTDPLLRVQSPLAFIGSIMENGSSSSTKFVFSATGRLSLTTSKTLTFGGTKYASDVQRVVCVSLGGRARIAGDGNSACE